MTQTKKTETKTEAQKQEGEKLPMLIGNTGVELRNIQDLWRFAEWVVQSGFAPKGLDTPQAAAIAVQMGLEVGLSPMAAIQNIAVINGRPSIWGDAIKGLVEASGLCEEFDEWYEGKEGSDEFAACCRIKRRGRGPIEERFSIGDAKKAGLWNKGSVWPAYPKRMLRYRCRAFACRDTFPDVIKGLRIAEEAQDIIDVTPTEPERPKRRANLDDLANAAKAEPETTSWQPEPEMQEQGTASAEDDGELFGGGEK